MLFLQLLPAFLAVKQSGLLKTTLLLLNDSDCDL